MFSCFTYKQKKYPIPNTQRSPSSEVSQPRSLNQTQRFPSALAPLIKERLLPDGNDAIPLPLASIVIGRSVENRAIIPNGKVILSPAETNLEIVILRNKLGEIVLENLALSLGDAVDLARLDLLACCEEGLPACHGVGTDDGTFCGE